MYWWPTTIEEGGESCWVPLLTQFYSHLNIFFSDEGTSLTLFLGGLMSVHFALNNGRFTDVKALNIPFTDG